MKGEDLAAGAGFGRTRYESQDLGRRRRQSWRLRPSGSAGCRAPALALVFALSLGAALILAGPLSATQGEEAPGDLAAAQQTIEALRLELAKTKKQHAELKTVLDRTRGEIAEALEELFASTTWKSDPEVVVLRGKLDAAAKEIKILSAVAEGAKAEAAAAKTALRAKTSKIAALAKEKDGALSETLKLRKSLAAVRQDAEQREAEAAKLAKFESARQAAAARIQALEAKLDKAEVAAADAKGMRAALRQARLRSDELEANLRAYAGQNKALRTRLDKTQGEISERIEQIFAAATGAGNRENAELREQLGARDKEISGLKAAKLEGKGLKRQIATLQQKAAALRSALSVAESAQKKASAAEVRALREAAEISSRRSEALATEKQAVESERDELAKKYEQAQQAAQAALAKADSAAKVAARAVRASASEADTLRGRLSAAKRELNRMKAELANARAEMKNARDNNYERIEKLILAATEAPGAELADLKAKLAMAMEEIARLRAALSERSRGAVFQGSTQ